MKSFKTFFVASLLLVASSSPAFAATDSDDTVVNATIGQELSLTATPSVTLKQDPIAGTGDLTPTKPVGGSTTIDVVSTFENVDVTIANNDNDTANLKKVSGSGPAQLYLSLYADFTSNVAVDAAGVTSGVNTYGAAFNGIQNPQYVVSGSSNFDHVVNFIQALDPSEDVVAGDTYSATATFEATGY